MNDVRRYLSSYACRALALERSSQTSTGLLTVAAVVLFVDVSGYTRMTYEAVHSGAEEVEHFGAALNAYFSSLVEVIADHGGDVIGFAGDAVLALFSAPEAASSGAAAQQAARAALGLRGFQLLGAASIPGDSRAGMARITIASGAAWFAAFGRDGRRQHVLAAGEAWQRLAACHDSGCSPGTIAVDRTTCALLAGSALFEPLPGVDGSVAQALVGLVDRGSEPVPVNADLERAEDLSRESMLRCLSPAIVERITNRQTRWLAEIRFLCPIFVRVGTGADSSPLDAPAIVRLVLALEDELHRLDGELRQVITDEIGLVMVGMFGTPGYTHEDDPLRATQAAYNMRETAIRLGVHVSCGVSSGSSLCGVFGSDRRQDYIIVGDSMNLAARLMQLNDGALCDQRTANLAGRFVAPPLVAHFLPKGFANDVAYVRLADGRRHVSVEEGHGEGARPRNSHLIGRASEKGRIESCLRQIRSGPSAPEDRCLLIEGEAGMGKSALVRFALERARELLLSPVLVAGDRLESLTPYYVWRSVLLQLPLFSGSDSSSTPELTKAIEAVLSRAPDLTGFTPLLREILPLELEDNAITAQMEPAARATMTVRLLLRMLESALANPAVLVFEDSHWIDSASWSVLSQLVKSLPDTLVIITMRPQLELAAGPTRDFIASCRPHGIALLGLSETETSGVISSFLGARDTAPDVVRFINRRSGGNPFFSQELALALRERGELSVQAGACIARQGLSGFAELGLPDTVRSTLLERIDRLNAAQQLLLKVASVIGSVAPVRLLRDILEIQGGWSGAESQLADMESRQLADVRDQDGEPCVCFRHAITQEAAYQLLTPSQKKSIHGAVARWYENANGAKLDPWLPLLAHHFRAAEDTAKALHYSSLAGEQALQGNANTEAVHFLVAALQLEQSLTVDPIDMSRRRRMLAEAHLKLSDLAACRDRLTEALKLAGRPLLQNRWALAFQVALALLPEMLPISGSVRVQKSIAPATSLLRAQLYQMLAEVAYYEHDTMVLLHGTFSGIREARGYVASRELASAHATAGVVTGLMTMRTASERHIARAQRAAAAAGHVPTQAYVNQLTGVCASSNGDWAIAHEMVGRAADGYRVVGDDYRWRATRMLLAFNALHQGRFEQIQSLLEQADEHAVFPSGPLQLRIWFRTAQLARANVLAAAGTGEPPTQALIDDVCLLAQSAAPSQAPLCRGFAADAFRLRRNEASANEQAQLGLAVFRNHRPTTYFSLLGIVSIGEAFVGLAEQDAGSRSALEDGARLALRELRRFAVMVPIAEPCRLLLEGRLLGLDGKREDARRFVRRSAARAAELHMSGVESAASRALATMDGTPASGGKLGWA